MNDIIPIQINAYSQVDVLILLCIGTQIYQSYI